MDSIPYPRNSVYRHFANLLPLLDYAHQHEHSRLWGPAILTMLARRGGAHG